MYWSYIFAKSFSSSSYPVGHVVSEVVVIGVRDTDMRYVFTLLTEGYDISHGYYMWHSTWDARNTIHTYGDSAEPPYVSHSRTSTHRSLLSAIWVLLAEWLERLSFRALSDVFTDFLVRIRLVVEQSARNPPRWAGVKHSEIKLIVGVSDRDCDYFITLAVCVFQDKIEHTSYTHVLMFVFQVRKCCPGFWGRYCDGLCRFMLLKTQWSVLLLFSTSLT